MKPERNPAGTTAATSAEQRKIIQQSFSCGCLLLIESEDGVLCWIPFNLWHHVYNGEMSKKMRRKSLSFGQTTLGLPPPWPLAFPFLREKNSILQLAGGRLRNPHWGYLIWFAPGCWSVRPHIFWHHPACPLCLWPVSNVTQRVGWAIAVTAVINLPATGGRKEFVYQINFPSTHIWYSSNWIGLGS